MKAQRFDDLVSQTQMGRAGGGSSKALTALRLHLVGGKPIYEAAAEAEVSPQAVYTALKNLPRKTCEYCGAVLKEDQPGKRAHGMRWSPKLQAVAVASLARKKKAKRKTP